MTRWDLSAEHPWKTARGQGTPFKAPLGQIEFVEGLETVHADIWMEVTDLDSMRDVLAQREVQVATEMQADRVGLALSGG